MMLERACTGGVDRATVAVYRVSPAPRTVPTYDLSVAGTIFGRCVKRGTGRRHSPPRSTRGDAETSAVCSRSGALPTSSRCQGSDVRRRPSAAPALLSRRRAHSVSMRADNHGQHRCDPPTAPGRLRAEHGSCPRWRSCRGGIRPRIRPGQRRRGGSPSGRPDAVSTTKAVSSTSRPGRSAGLRQWPHADGPADCGPGTGRTRCEHAGCGQSWDHNRMAAPRPEQATTPSKPTTAGRYVVCGRPRHRRPHRGRVASGGRGIRRIVRSSLSRHGY